MTAWERLAAKHPRLEPWVNEGLSWATKYYGRMDLTGAYVLTMCKHLFTLYILLFTGYLISSQSVDSLFLVSKTLGA
jgi:hypothetical protein